MPNIVSRSRAATGRVAATLVRSLLRTRRRGPLLLALSGELGSGKTAFVQGLARALGIRANVQSPTFVIAKWYRLGRAGRPFRHLAHVDAYRLTPREARHLGLERAFEDRDALVAVEWAERIRKLIPQHAVWVRFRHSGALRRIISVGAPMPKVKGRRTKARRTVGL